MQAYSEHAASLNMFNVSKSMILTNTNNKTILGPKKNSYLINNLGKTSFYTNNQKNCVTQRVSHKIFSNFEEDMIIPIRPYMCPSSSELRDIYFPFFIIRRCLKINIDLKRYINHWRFWIEILKVISLKNRTFLMNETLAIF